MMKEVVEQPEGFLVIEHLEHSKSEEVHSLAIAHSGAYDRYRFQDIVQGFS